MKANLHADSPAFLLGLSYVQALLGLAFLIGLIGASHWVLAGYGIPNFQFSTSLCLMIASIMSFAIISNRNEKQSKWVAIYGLLLLIIAGSTFVTYLQHNPKSMADWLEYYHIGQLYAQNPVPMAFLTSLSFSMLGMYGAVFFCCNPKPGNRLLLTGFVAVTILAYMLLNLIGQLLGTPFFPNTPELQTSIPTSIGLIFIATALIRHEQAISA